MQDRLHYLMIVVSLHSILSFSMVFFGSGSLIAVKLGRVGINLIASSSMLIWHLKYRYAVTTIMPIYLLSLGVINTMALKSTGSNVTTSGKASEVIGSENTTIVFIGLIFINNSPKYCMLVLSPIYLLINIAMLITVKDEVDDD